MATASRSERNEAAPGDVLGAALAYALRGWLVFPVRGKVPLTEDGFKSATTDPARIAHWYERYPDAGVAIATGAGSGLVVLDEDVPKGGAGSLKKLKERAGDLPKTYTVLTGGGGRHYYFAHPGETVTCSAGKLGTGLDVRADGGYVVAAPSPHESGRPYKVLHDVDLAPIPAGLLAEAATQTKGVAPAIGETIKKGERDTTLASLAGTMRRRGMDESAILAALRTTNRERCQPPLPDRDVERIAASVARYPSEKQNAEPFELQVLSARALCQLPDPPGSDELLGPLVVRGQRVVLGAHTGHGKTTLALQIVRAVLSGETLLDWNGVGGTRALVIDAEQGLKTIKRRLSEAGLADSDLVDYVRVPDGLDLDADERHVVEVERVLEAGDYGLVIADPLYKLHTGDSNAEREAVDLMKRFDAWRERFQFALVLPVHCRKPMPGSKFSIHDLFGSSAYVRGAEVVLGLQRVSDGYAKLHFLKDRDGDLPIGAAWGMLFGREDGFRRDPNDGKRETATDKIRELLADDPTLTQQQLQEVSGYAERTVRKALKEIRDVEQTELLEAAT